MSKLTLMLVVSALVLTIFVSGCGGNEEGPGTSTVAGTTTVPPRTKTEYIKSAEKICIKADRQKNDEAIAYRERHEKELEELGRVPGEEKLVRVIVLPLIKKQVDELEALGAPKGEEKEIKAIFARVDAEIRELEKSPDILFLEGFDKYPLEGYARLAREYGLNECSYLG